jgi:hypothetical protein
MNWIKNNRFLSGLIGITGFLCAVLFYFSTKWSNTHAENKAAFDESFMDVASSEGIPLYPSSENRDGKSKALASHKAEIETLSNAFDPFRTAELKPIQPQAFTDQLKQATAQVSTAFSKNKAVLPEDFFLGFETYKNQLAQSGATGALLYQLNGMKHVFNALSQAKVGELVRIYREPLLEENSQTFQAAPDAVARFFPFELTIRATETSLRQFVSSLGSLDSQYFIIRSIAVKNRNISPPKISDAKFEASAQTPRPDASADDFSAEIDFDELESEGEDKDMPAPEAAADSSKILAQVLGDEELDVLLRIDLALLLPAKQLPKP